MIQEQVFTAILENINAGLIIGIMAGLLFFLFFRNKN